MRPTGLEAGAHAARERLEVAARRRRGECRGRFVDRGELGEPRGALRAGRHVGGDGGHLRRRQLAVQVGGQPLVLVLAHEAPAFRRCAAAPR